MTLAGRALRKDSRSHSLGRITRGRACKNGPVTPSDPVEIRRAEPGDRKAILVIGSRALGWESAQRTADLFEWKHDRNPFGPSFVWVAEAEGRVVGFRAFMRWRLERDGEAIDAVRAVDTATDPDFWGQGVFRTLTTHALGELGDAGIAAVFNLPNAKSLPGYLKMGWTELGRPALGVVPRSLPGLVRAARERAPAEKWSEVCSVGEPATAVLDGHSRGARPGEHWPPGRWSTAQAGGFLRWRYGLDHLRYRALRVRGGWCVFRVRRRGRAREVAVCEWLSPDPDPRALRRLVTATSGDYAVGLGLTLRAHGALPVPRQGPVVAWRAVGRPLVPDLSDLAFTLGDLELF